jgi:UDP-N-acetylglucosamine 2-epimerase (non-hydrolysing)
MEKVITIVGTRPEIIRTSCIVPKLDRYCNHTVIHTNQNPQVNMKDKFYEELGLRQPDICFKSSVETATHTEYGLGSQLGTMFPQIEKIFKDIKPDKVFILGDTNSALCAIIAERMGIPVYHMEAANRSFNRNIPEEVNRRLIDSISTYNLFYTTTNRMTLLREGCNPKNIFQCGNPTYEVLYNNWDKIEGSKILDVLGLTKGEYFLVDIHRSENTNDPNKLLEIIEGLNLVDENLKLPVVCSVHPRTKDKLKDLSYRVGNIKFLDSFGFFDFVHLEKYAKVGLTDSGLCSEEYNLLKVPCVIVRNETERPEVVEAGGAIISGINSERILECTEKMTKIDKNWKIPEGYDDVNVSDKVVNFILGAKQ